MKKQQLSVDGRLFERSKTKGRGGADQGTRSVQTGYQTLPRVLFLLERHTGKCCMEDDMEQVIQDLLWADITIWSFPLYYFTVPGGLKNLIDRQTLPHASSFYGRKGGTGRKRRSSLTL